MVIAAINWEPFLCQCRTLVSVWLIGMPFAAKILHPWFHSDGFWIHLSNRFPRVWDIHREQRANLADLFTMVWTVLWPIVGVAYLVVKINGNDDNDGSGPWGTA